MPTVTPILAIPVPDSATRLPNLGAELVQAFSALEQKFVAAAFPPVQGVPVVVAASDAARDAEFGTPVLASDRRLLQDAGALVVRPDRGWVERYFADYNASTNPAGATPAGWYPLSAAPTAHLGLTADLAGGVAAAPTPVRFSSATRLRGLTYSSAQPTRLTFTTTGLALLTATAAIGSTSTGQAWFRFNGTVNRPAPAAVPHSSGIAIATTTDIYPVTAGDYVELMTLSNGAFNLYASTTLDANVSLR